MANFCPHASLFATDLTTTLACLFRTQSELHNFNELITTEWAANPTYLTTKMNLPV